MQWEVSNKSEYKIEMSSSRRKPGPNYRVVMSNQTFGFRCGDFSVALSGNQLVLPGSKNQPLRKSLLPFVAMEDAAGLYTLEVKVDNSIVCHMPVHVAWVEHESQPEPFLGFKSNEPQEVRAALAVYVGKPVELQFTPK